MRKSKYIVLANGEVWHRFLGVPLEHVEMPDDDLAVIMYTPEGKMLLQDLRELLFHHFEDEVALGAISEQKERHRRQVKIERLRIIRDTAFKLKQRGRID